MRRILPILLLGLVAACSKDKDPDRPAKLVAFPETLKIQKVWSESVGGSKVPLRLGLGLNVEGETVYAAGEKGEVGAFNLQNGRREWDVRTKLPLGGAVGFGEGRPDPNGAAQQVLSHLRAAGLSGYYTQQTQGVGMIGLRGEDLVVQPFRFGKAARLVMSHSGIELLPESRAAERFHCEDIITGVGKVSFPRKKRAGWTDVQPAVFAR